MKHILIDLLVLWLSIVLGAYAFNHHAPVLALIAVICFVTGVVWLAMDFTRGMMESNHDETNE